VLQHRTVCEGTEKPLRVRDTEKTGESINDGGLLDASSLKHCERFR
jgi:hypothetical protein